MKQLGEPASLRTNGRHIIFAADRGRPTSAYQYNWLHCVLPEVLPADKALEATLRVLETFSEQVQLHLQIEVKNLQADDEISVQLNGQPVSDWQRVSSDRLQAPIAPATLRPGSNKVQMRLAQRSSQSKDDRVVNALELHVLPE